MQWVIHYLLDPSPCDFIFSACPQPTSPWGVLLENVVTFDLEESVELAQSPVTIKHSVLTASRPPTVDGVLLALWMGKDCACGVDWRDPSWESVWMATSAATRSILVGVPSCLFIQFESRVKVRSWDFEIWILKVSIFFFLLPYAYHQSCECLPMFESELRLGKLVPVNWTFCKVARILVRHIRLTCMILKNFRSDLDLKEIRPSVLNINIGSHQDLQNHLM